MRIDCGRALEDYGKMVYRIAFSHVAHKQDAEDIFQEVFLKAAKKKEFSSQEHLKAWLIRVAVNGSISYLRKKKELPLNESIAFMRQGTYEGGLDILAAVHTLEKEARSVIYLYYYEGYGLNEIAGLLKINPSTVRSIHARAKQKLKNILGEDYEQV